MQNRTAKILLLGYIALFAWAAIHPYDRATWWAENIPIVRIALFLVGLYLGVRVLARGLRLYVGPALPAHDRRALHFRAGTFWFCDGSFGFQRNHYDRMAHFSVGFYAYAIAEALVRTRAVRSRVVLFLFPVFAIAFVAMGYELIEWWYAAADGGSPARRFWEARATFGTPRRTCSRTRWARWWRRRLFCARKKG